MPGVDQMQGYNMRYGPSPIMELPLAVNPTGSARSEPLLRTHFRSARYVPADPQLMLLHIAYAQRDLTFIHIVKNK